MAEPKTKPTDASVDDHIASIADVARREDCAAITRLMERVTGERPRMWGTSIVGFGTYRYVYASGQSGDWPVVGFSSRKGDLSIYLMTEFPERAELLARLGKHKTGKSCLYVRRLSDIDLPVLEELVRKSAEETRRRHG
ncbi:MAG: DUF1801 domain-containing protein [Isosphaeraceae bacterium]